jgi:hypothetical protein
MTEYQELKQKFLKLCEIYNLPKPKISKATKDDICDFTCYDKVRIKPVGCDIKYHASHVFGHWLCDLHLDSDSELQDKVADLISDLIRFDRVNW